MREPPSDSYHDVNSLDVQEKIRRSVRLLYDYLEYAKKKERRKRNAGNFTTGGRGALKQRGPQRSDNRDGSLAGNDSKAGEQRLCPRRLEPTRREGQRVCLDGTI